MDCSKFEEYGLLYIYDELDAKSNIHYENHIKDCDFCQKEIAEIQDTLGLVKDLPVFQPSAQIVHSIFKVARKSRKNSIWKFPILHKIGNFFHPNTLRWAIPVMTAIILVALIFNPSKRNSNFEMNVNLLAWEDDILTQVMELDSEIDDFSSGTIYDEFTLLEDISDEASSIFNDDLGSIHNQLIELGQSMVEI